MDFAKAFDTVPHKRLLNKLKAYGITGNLLRWIESFLVGRTQAVKVKGTLPRLYLVTSFTNQPRPISSLLGGGL